MRRLMKTLSALVPVLGGLALLAIAGGASVKGW